MSAHKERKENQSAVFLKKFGRVLSNWFGLLEDLEKEKKFLQKELSKEEDKIKAEKVVKQIKNI